MTGGLSRPEDRFLRRAAEGISILTVAPVVAIPVFLVIVFLMVQGPGRLLLSSVSILFAGIIPLSLILFWSRIVHDVPSDIPDRRDRHGPFVTVILSYAVGTAALALLHAPWLVTGLMLCYCTNTLAVFLVNLVWKISIHAMGIAGPATALAFAAGPAGLIPAFVLLPPVMLSRVYLGRHTTAQVVAGAALGFLLTGIQLAILSGFR